jgi:hypothetical protein
MLFVKQLQRLWLHMPKNVSTTLQHFFVEEIGLIYFFPNIYFLILIFTAPLALWCPSLRSSLILERNIPFWTSKGLKDYSTVREKKEWKDN